jgi:hypothetical protein
MNSEQRARALRNLADGITRRRLALPASMILDVIEPLGFLASQVALFARPFAPLGHWHDYATALEDEASWKELHSLIDQRRQE